MLHAALALGLLGCRSPQVELRGHTAEMDTGTTSPGGAVTWSNGVADLFREHCVRCHASGRFATYAPLATYEQVRGRLANIEQKVVDPPGWGTQMPPWPGGSVVGACEPAHPYTNDLRLTTAELDVILAWIDAGAPRGSGPLDEPLEAPPPARLDDATAYPFAEGYRMRIGADDRTGHEDDHVCVVVDPGTVAGSRFLAGVQIEPEVRQIFRGAVVWLDERRESQRFLRSDSPRRHGADWYDCDDGFGFDGSILGGFLPEGEPIALPPGSAVEVPGDALIVYKVHYHAHYDHVDPEDTTPLPPVLEWEDHTALSLVWVEEAEVEAPATLLTFGNSSDAVQAGSGTLSAPFEVPAGQSGVESMVTLVPGTPDDLWAVWAVQPEMKKKGRSVRISAERRDGSSECLGATPRWDASWQAPLTFDPTTGAAPLVRGGDRLRADCEYKNDTDEPLTLERESCRAMVGVVPVDDQRFRSPPGRPTAPLGF